MFTDDDRSKLISRIDARGVENVHFVSSGQYSHLTPGGSPIVVPLLELLIVAPDGIRV